MFELPIEAFLIPENIKYLEMGVSLFNINGKYIILEENKIKLENFIKNSILYSSIKQQGASFITGVMIILDLFKLNNIFIDDEMNLYKNIKWNDYKTSNTIIDIFKYIIDSISSELKCIMERIFTNNRKILFYILLSIIGVENYEKIGYQFITGGRKCNDNNLSNALYRLMHECIFGPIMPNGFKRTLNRKRKIDDDIYIPSSNKKICNTNIQTRNYIMLEREDIFKYDSEIFHYSFLQDGKDLIVPDNIFD
jgi:hypothetical protein